MKKILLTGKNGFIGSALIARLEEINGISIQAISRSNGIDLSRCNYFSKIDDVYEVVHLAGSVGVELGWESPYEMYRNNVLPTLSLLELARQRQIHFTYISSYIYGPPQYLPVDETHPIRCNNPYANSKRQAEMICQSYASDFGVPVTILRLFNIFGPGQSRKNLIPHIIHQATKKNSVTVQNLSPKRDFLYVDDLISALLKVILSDENREGMDVFNLGYGQSHSVEDVINIVVKKIGKEIPVNVIGRQRPDEVMDCYCDFRKFSSRYGWKPKTSIEAGISKLLSLV